MPAVSRAVLFIVLFAQSSSLTRNIVVYLIPRAPQRQRFSGRCLSASPFPHTSAQNNSLSSTHLPPSTRRKRLMCWRGRGGCYQFRDWDPLPHSCQRTQVLLPPAAALRHLQTTRLFSESCLWFEGIYMWFFWGGKATTHWLSQSWWYRRKVWCCQTPFQGAGDVESTKWVKAAPRKQQTKTNPLRCWALMSQPGWQSPWSQTFPLTVHWLHWAEK